MPLPDIVNYLVLSVVDDAETEVRGPSEQVAGSKVERGQCSPSSIFRRDPVTLSMS